MQPSAPARWLLLTAFAIVYIVWGSSYLGIHFALETLPPFIMTGVRFTFGGLLVVGWLLLRGAPFPTRIQWRSAFILGVLFFVLNNGGIVWAEKMGLPTGIAALLISTLPIWIVLLNWARRGGSRPTGRTVWGIGVGFAGVLLLMASTQGIAGAPSIGIAPMLMVLAASIAWAVGSLYGKHAPLPDSAFMATGIQLLAGGAMQLALSVIAGEWATFDPAAISLRSAAATVYLAIASSIIAFGAFVWLMRVEKPERVATYAYVNPVIAVILGWLLAGERLAPLTLVAAGVIVGGVVIIVGGERFKWRLPTLGGRARDVARREA